MTAIIKIAVLDDYQSISPSIFSSLPSSTFETTVFTDTLPSYAHPSTPSDAKAQLVARLHRFAVIVSMRERTPFPSALLSQLPNLKLLLTTGTRNAAIDFAACERLGIRSAGTWGRGSERAAAATAATAAAAPQRRRPPPPDTTTQHTVALLLGLVRNLVRDDATVGAGGWQTGLAIGLPGKTLACLGLGRLGGAVAGIMWQSFGMQVVAWSTGLTQEAADERAAALGLPVADAKGQKTFRVVSKEELFRQADVLSVHYVLSERSRGMVGETELAWMKKSSFLVNTSRGPLIDEDALLDVLERGQIGGAAIDVFEFEPLKKDSRWRTTEWGSEGRSTVLLSPHMGYVDGETLTSWYEECKDNVERWHGGKELTTPLA